MTIQPPNQLAGRAAELRAFKPTPERGRQNGVDKATPTKPADIDAPGCRLRPGAIYWIARQDIADRGYPTKTVRLWAASAGKPEPPSAQWQDIGKQCQRLQREMIAWGRTSKLNR